MQLPLVNLLRRSPRVPEHKASRTGALLALFGEGRARWTPRDYAALAREGYQKNPVAFRCVRLISQAVAGLPLVLTEGARELDAHPLLDLLGKPNPRETRAEFLERAAGHLLTAGNAYLELVSVAGSPRELHALRPDRMKVVPGGEGWPEAFEYTAAGRTVRFDMRERPAPILHLTFFHPLDDHYGFAPLEAAHLAVDVHNAASAWTKSLLDNAARPSGALVYSAGGGNLSEEQFERLKGELEENYQGARNAGRPLLLEGGLDWKPLSLSPKDMDFIAAKHTAAREIALAFGVPPMLLGIPGDNTYSNYTEANRALYRETVLPLAQRICDALANWLAPVFAGEGGQESGQRSELGSGQGSGQGSATSLRLAPDLDQVSALATERESLWARVNAATFLTDDERRAAVGYGVREEFPESIKRYDPNQPRVPRGNSDGGQWTDGGGSGSPSSDFDDLPASADEPFDVAVAPGSAALLRLLARVLARSPKIPPGTTIRNRALAGKKHPGTDIPFNKDGFADFSGVATKTVKVPHTGIRSIDSAAANRAAGYKSTPEGMTWHHHQDGRTMQLVPRSLHEKTAHTGSIGLGNTPGKR